MDAARRAQILDAARALGADDFNRLVEAVEQSLASGRLRYWQEDLLGRLGVGPVTHADFLAAFAGAVPLPVRRRRRATPHDDPPARPHLDHPRLGRLTQSEDEDDDEDGESVRVWEGTVPLPSFAARGAARRSGDGPPPGRVPVLVQAVGGAVGGAVGPEQDAAVAHLLAHEPAVFAAVWAELAPEFDGFDLDTDVLCTEVVVSWLHAGGVAYLGFTIDAGDHPEHMEHGFQVVYHPTRGTSWGDWEAVGLVDDADN